MATQTILRILRMKIDERYGGWDVKMPSYF